MLDKLQITWFNGGKKFMATLDINQLIQESVTKSMGSSPSDKATITDAFLNSIVEEVKKSETPITLRILQEAFADVFKSEDNVNLLKQKLTDSEVQIEGFNFESSDLSDNPFSTAIGLIASGVGAKKYLTSSGK